MLSSVIGNALALFFAWMFAVAGIQKLRAPNYYLNLISSYIPAASIGRLLLLPLAGGELAIAILLLLPATRAYGLAGSAFLLLAYAVMMAWQVWRGQTDMDCGCSGPASDLSVSPVLVVRNLVCAGLAILSLSVLASVAVGIMGMVLSVVVASFIITFYLCSDQLIANAQQMAGDV